MLANTGLPMETHKVGLLYKLDNIHRTDLDGSLLGALVTKSIKPRMIRNCQNIQIEGMPRLQPDRGFKNPIPDFQIIKSVS